jgi:transposase InsO family protein
VTSLHQVKYYVYLRVELFGNSEQLPQFTSLQQVRDIAWEWMIDYNEQRPHDALQGLTATAYRKKICAGYPSLELYA